MPGGLWDAHRFYRLPHERHTLGSFVLLGLSQHLIGVDGPFGKATVSRPRPQGNYEFRVVCVEQLRFQHIPST